MNRTRIKITAHDIVKLTGVHINTAYSMIRAMKDGSTKKKMITFAVYAEEYGIDPEEILQAIPDACLKSVK